MFTQMSSTKCNHQHCQHTFPIYVVNDQLQLCIHPCSDNVKRQRQEFFYHHPIQIVYPEDVLSHVQTTSNHTVQDPGSREHVPTHPSPDTAADFTHHDGGELHCPFEQNDTMLKQFWLFMANSQPNLILQECAVLLAIDRCTNWHRMVMHKSTSAEDHEVHDFQCYRWVMTITCMALWSLLSMCGIHNAQTFCFPKLLVGIR